MNEVFIIGTVTSKIDLKFCVTSKKYFSKARFKIKTQDKQILKIIAYNETADYCYRNLKLKNTIFIEGKLNTKMEVEVKQIFYICDISLFLFL